MVGLHPGAIERSGAWPLRGAVVDEPRGCWAYGRWVVLQPSQCTIVDLGVESRERARLNEKKNNQRRRVRRSVDEDD